MSGALRRAVLGVVVSVGIGGYASLAAQTPAREWPSERAPAPLQAREATFPPYEMRTLANGMQVITVLHHEQPVISMRLLVRAGSARGPITHCNACSLNWVSRREKMSRCCPPASANRIAAC